MRSQIACSHCRRSKVKCVNIGTDSVCKACANQNRECTYPEVGSGGQRRESVVDGTGETPRVKRQKKMAPPNSQSLYLLKKQSSPAQLTDHALDPQTLTPQIWHELFDIFQQHYATDLPFLHAPTFCDDVHKLPALLRLAFLALTARFHSALVQRNGGNAIQAAEFYAEAAREQLAPYGLPGETSVNTVQALLMLGIHEWGMARGAKAYHIIGMAISCADILGLQVEPDLDLNPEACATAQCPKVPKVYDPPRTHSKEQEVIEKEIRRRTFWSCFIMDRYLSFGKYRIQKLEISKIRVQLPCSDTAFIFGHEVYTMLLGETELEARTRFKHQRELKWAKEKRARDHWATEHRNSLNATYSYQTSDVDDDPKDEIADSEGILSRYIRAIDLFGQVIQWACTGGRRLRQDVEFAPWDSRTTFYKLEKGLKTLIKALPRELTLTPNNTAAHIANKTSRHYTLMHALHLLCNIALYREYMGFLPFDEPIPRGPVDEPKLPEDRFPRPYADYWEKQARECFKAARSLIDLLHACEKSNVLVETPLSGFATWQAVTCGIYAYFFPNMDMDSSMSTNWSRSTSDDHVQPIDSSGHEAFLRSTRMLKHMSKGLKMAVGWGETNLRLRNKIWNTRKKWNKDPGALKGRGLEEYLEMEKELKEFGDNSKDRDVNEHVTMPDYSPEPKDEDVIEPSSATLKHERTDDTPEIAPSPWAAVNSNRKPDIESAASRTCMQYQPGPQMASNTAQDQDITVSRPTAYTRYVPLLTNRHMSCYEPTPALLAQRTSIVSQHIHNQIPANRDINLYAQSFPNDMRYSTFEASDLFSFSGGLSKADWETQPHGWMSQLWNPDESSVPVYANQA